MSYAQLTQEQRYQIYELLKTGCSQTKIAETIEVHKSTISREVRRNQGKRGYRPKQAHHIALQRRNKAKKRISEDERKIIDDRLKDDWSPEQISNKLNQLYDIQVSHEWLYHHVQEDKQHGGKLHEHLRRLKKYGITQETVTSEVKYPKEHRFKSAQRSWRDESGSVIGKRIQSLAKDIKERL